MTKIQPINGHALIKLEKEPEEKKIGGVIIPKTAEEN